MSIYILLDIQRIIFTFIFILLGIYLCICLTKEIYYICKGSIEIKTSKIDCKRQNKKVSKKSNKIKSRAIKYG